MEGVALDHLRKLYPSTILMAKSHCQLSNESDQDNRSTATHLHILLQFPLAKGMLAPLLITIWYHMDGCAKQCRCQSDINILSCLALYYYIIINIVVGVPINIKGVLDGMNDIKNG